MEELTLHDILMILNRRKRQFIITAAAVFALSLLFALHWSNYRSTATVQIEQPNVSQTLATPTGVNPEDMVEALADQRISQVEQTVTSIDSLGAIIDKYKLYGGQLQSTPIAVLAAKMRDKIKLDFISSTIANPAEAQKASAEQLSAIAFTLSFDYSDPETTQQVTNELVSRFLEEDLELRRRQAEETSAFLQAQIAGMEETMADQERKMADFRGKNGESGPAALMFNQQALQSTTMNLQTLNSEISANEGTLGNLRAQLATVDPYSRVIADGQVVTTPAVQLKALQAQYESLSSQYGPTHPDVIKAHHQIEALEAAVKKSGGGKAAPSEDVSALESQIKDIETNLVAARATKGDNNPDVIALTAQLKKLEARRSEAQSDRAVSELKADADNPAYLQLASQLQAAEAQHKAYVTQHDQLQEQLEKYQRAVSANPVIEQQMDALSRDYDNEQLRYRELREKKMAADMSAQLETQGKGQRLLVNIPPNLPTKTHPSRLALIVGGAFLSVLAGAGAVVAVEGTNQSIQGAHQLAQLVGAPPLVSIPHITTMEEIVKAEARRPYVIAGIALLVVLGLIIFPYTVMPYDVLWSELSQKLHL